MSNGPDKDGKYAVGWYPIPMSAEICPGERRWVVVQPQVLFRAASLVYDGPPNAFRLHDVAVGKNSQLASVSMPMLMESFSLPVSEFPHALKRLVDLADRLDVKASKNALLPSEEVKVLREAAEAVTKRIRNLGECDTCQIGMHFSLLVENVSIPKQYGSRSYGPSDFKCIVYGDSIEDRPSLR